MNHDTRTTPGPSTRASTRTWARRTLETGLGLTLGLATLAGIVLAGATVTSRSVNPPVTTSSARRPAESSSEYAEPTVAAEESATPHPGRRLVVAFVVGADGTIASDLLAPYDIFASSPAFTTYLVADTTTAAPLEGGPAVFPTYTYADVDARPELTPDLVVVPGLTHPTGSAEGPLRSWVGRQHDAGANVLGVCTGALVLAETGMLDGLHATSHWSRITALESSRPAVHWERGRRYVQDGSITTAAAVTSGVPAALHLVAQLAGPVEAQRVADLHPELHWTPAQATAISMDHFAVRDWPVGLNYVMPWWRPTIGVALQDGVGELDAIAAFEVYSQSAAAHAVAIAADDTVRTRHGLVLSTTAFTDAPHLSRIVVPGADATTDLDARLRDWADEQQLTVEPLDGRSSGNGAAGTGGFTAALENLAAHSDAGTAAATAKMIGYPTLEVNLGDRHRSPRPVLLATASIAVSILLGLAPALLLRRRRRSRRARLPHALSGPVTVRT